MARPKSEDKRDALMAAATRVIAAQGLSAPTAVIAREAGVSNGSLFTYFETKADLFNQLYLELKAGMAVGHFSAGFTAQRFRSIEVKGAMEVGVVGGVWGGDDRLGWTAIRGS